MPNCASAVKELVIKKSEAVASLFFAYGRLKRYPNSNYVTNLSFGY